jgi:cytochrome c-type protein NapC
LTIYLSSQGVLFLDELLVLAASRRSFCLRSSPRARSTSSTSRKRSAGCIGQKLCPIARGRARCRPRRKLWGKIFGTIDTRQKFQDHRLELAKHEWARLKANDSLECRNCHSAVATDFIKKARRAADIHGKFLVTDDKTCIDCHKGIAHELPDMTGIEPAGEPHPN